MADESSALLFQILLDQAAQQDTERGLSNIENLLQSLDETELVNLNNALIEAQEKARAFEDRLKSTREEATRLSQISGNITRVSTAFGAAGAAVVGGLALSARQYVKFVEDAGIRGDETADRWIAATKRIKNAQLNLGEASAQVLLPIYEKAAELAEKAAAFVQKNPDLVQAALNTGIVVATLAAVGVAVSKGIKIYADFKYLAATAEYDLATRRFEKSVGEFLAGAVLGKTNGSNAAAVAAGGAGVLGKAGAAIGTVALYASAVVIGAEAGVALGNALGKLVYGEDYKKQGLGDAALTAFRTANAPLALIAIQLEKLGGVAGKAGDAIGDNLTKIDQWVQKLLGLETAADDASNATDKVASGLRDFQGEADLAQATDAFISYRQQEAQAEQQYSQQRAQLVQQGLEQINQIEANYVNQRAQLISQYEQSSANALASFNFQRAQAASQFAQQQAQAEQQHQENRKKAQESYQKETERAAKDHQKALQKLEEEHNDKVRDLVAARDALGLSREKRDYERRKRDLEENYSEEKKRRQEDYRQRLREMDEQFAKERAQRQADFEFRQQQAAEQFAFQQAQAKAQFEERLKQLDAQHNEELSKARQQQAEKLRELELAYRQEQVTRRNAFLDILRDLNANLLNEENLRNQYYARMQADLVNFLQSTASGVGNGSNLPGYQSGGYTPEGPIRTHLGEYVLDPQSTSSLEKLVGGRLTRDSIQNFAQGGGSTTVNMQFPGGMITRKMLNEALDKNTAKLLKNLTKGLVRA